MERWTGRVAIVTGGGSGIGRAIARLLACKGMRVVTASLDMDNMQELAEEVRGCCTGEIHPVLCDVRSESDIIKTVTWTRQTLGGADVLVNNAGVNFYKPTVELSTEEMRTILEVNVLGVSVFTREVLKDMWDRGVDDGHIFNTCSVLGYRLPAAASDLQLSFYTGSKHAVAAITEGLRRELRDKGSHIRLTNINPGLVRTSLYAAGGGSEAQVTSYYASNVHLQPENVAEALLSALVAPPNVQIYEVTVLPVGETLI